METAAVLTQIAIAVVAVAALVVSILAFRRTSLPDRKEHEHRDVSWDGCWQAGQKGEKEFVLKNTGSTTAKKVRAKVMTEVVGPLTDALNLGTFKPGESRAIVTRPTEAIDAIDLLIAALNQEGTPFTVNWISPLGTPDHFEKSYS